jgi:hypothetical protein
LAPIPPSVLVAATAFGFNDIELRDLEMDKEEESLESLLDPKRRRLGETWNRFRVPVGVDDAVVSS